MAKTDFLYLKIKKFLFSLKLLGFKGLNFKFSSDIAGS